MFKVSEMSDRFNVERNGRTYCTVFVQDVVTKSAVRRAKDRARVRAQYICDLFNWKPADVPKLVNEFRPEMYYTKEYIEREDTIHEPSVVES